MSTSRIIHNAITNKLFEFKNVYKYASHYQAFFEKVLILFIETFFYTCKNTMIYFQAIISINIGMKYSALVSTIKKDSKDKNRKLTEPISQITEQFEFIKGNKKAKAMQTLLYQSTTFQKDPTQMKNALRKI